MNLSFSGSLAALAVAAALLLAACGEDGARGGGPTVVATTAIAADVTRALAGGRLEVVQLVPYSANPHTYVTSAKDRRALAEADLVVVIGRDYEQGIPLGDGAPRFAIADHVERTPSAAGTAGTADRSGPPASVDLPSPRDPHVWMDPTRVAAAAPALARALARLDPAGGRLYARRARAYAASLHRLDRELAATLARVPRRDRKLVTSHDSLAFFAARYGFKVVAAPFGLQPEAEASAADIEEVVRRVRRAHVPAVFAQAGDDPKVMRQVAREAGVRVVDDLLVEGPGPAARTYPELLRYDARRVAGALAS
jgi:zinc/manganese transport system substrate-binding protein